MKIVHQIATGCLVATTLWCTPCIDFRFARCAEPLAGARREGEARVAIDNVRMAEDTFSLHLFDKARLESPEGNCFVSPLGVFEALVITRAAAAGESRVSLDRLLGATRDEDAFARQVKSLRQIGIPTIFQLGATVTDNDRYGVKIHDDPDPSSSLAKAKVRKGDLIFTIDGLPVRTAAEALRACEESLGTVSIDGFDFKEGMPFSTRMVDLVRRRRSSLPPHRHVVCNATAAWLNPRIVDSRIFSKTIRNEFGTSCFEADFTDAAIIEQQSSRFLESATAGRVTSASVPTGLGKDTAFLLVNAVAMDARWQRAFPPATHAEFRSADRTTLCWLMRHSNHYRYCESNGLQTVELPFRDSSLVIWIVLPSDLDGWRIVETKGVLSASWLNEIDGQMKMTEVDVGIPRFRVVSSRSLKDQLSQLGLSQLFTADANFGVLDSKESICLADVSQDSYFEINEQGARGGAVTQVVGVTKGLSDTKRKSLIATHPFFFIVRDREGGIVFLGRVTEPTVAHPEEASR